MHQQANPPDATSLLRRIRWVTAVMILGLVVSGITAIPLQWQLELAQRVVGSNGNAVADWVATLLNGVRTTQTSAPFIFYGTDWLAFGHIVIAISFIGAWRDPVRNIWLFRFGLIACALGSPLRGNSRDSSLAPGCRLFLWPAGCRASRLRAPLDAPPCGLCAAIS